MSPELPPPLAEPSFPDEADGVKDVVTELSRTETTGCLNDQKVPNVHITESGGLNTPSTEDTVPSPKRFDQPVQNVESAGLEKNAPSISIPNTKEPKPRLIGSALDRKSGSYASALEAKRTRLLEKEVRFKKDIVRQLLLRGEKVGCYTIAELETVNSKQGKTESLHRSSQTREVETNSSIHVPPPAIPPGMPTSHDVGTDLFTRAFVGDLAAVSRVLKRTSTHCPPPSVRIRQIEPWMSNLGYVKLNGHCLGIKKLGSRYVLGYGCKATLLHFALLGVQVDVLAFLTQYAEQDLAVPPSEIHALASRAQSTPSLIHLAETNGLIFLVDHFLVTRTVKKNRQATPCKKQIQDPHPCMG